MSARRASLGCGHSRPEGSLVLRLKLCHPGPPFSEGSPGGFSLFDQGGLSVQGINLRLQRLKMILDPRLERRYRRIGGGLNRRVDCRLAVTLELLNVCLEKPACLGLLRRMALRL